MELLFFGSLVDVTIVSRLNLDGIADTDLLRLHLEKCYPTLKSAKYFIAVNQQMIQGNVILKEGDTVALMPPFSGG